MSKNLVVSIIIPTYNRANTICKALNSVLDQTYSKWECIVVDDGSTDNSSKVLEEYTKKDKRIQWFERGRGPKGAPTCRNIGLENAKGDYVIFLDSDDYLLPFCLEQRIKMVNLNPDCDFLVFPMGIKRSNGIIEQKINPFDNHLVMFLSANMPWQTMCPIWKKSFLKKLGGFAEGYPRLNDPELMIRALLVLSSGYKIFDEFNYDTVFIPSPKQKVVHAELVFKSLELFVPDTCANLTVENKGHLRKYLIGYLYLWFKYFYKNQKGRKRISSLKLVLLFFRKRIISFPKYFSLTVRLLLFEISILLRKDPIDKFTGRFLYEIK